MNLSDSIYVDMDIYNYYTIIIGKITKNNKNYEMIKSVCENLYDTTYIKNKYNCDYFYRIPYFDVGNYNKLSLNKCTNNNDYDIFFDNIEKDYSKITIGSEINVLYKLESDKIIPIQIFTNTKTKINIENIDCIRIYMATFKINKIYEDFYDYEYFGLFEGSN